MNEMKSNTKQVCYLVASFSISSVSISCISPFCNLYQVWPDTPECRKDKSRGRNGHFGEMHPSEMFPFSTKTKAGSENQTLFAPQIARP